MDINALNPGPGLFVLWSTAIGAIVASFAGLAAWRLPHQLGWNEAPRADLTLWSPGSMCEGCGRRLGFFELVPVLGWILAMGRCKSCGHRVSPAYPLAEAASGAVSAAVAWHLGWGPQSLAALFLLWGCIVLAWIDIREHWLPEIFTIPLFWIGLLFSPLDGDAWSRAAGAALAFAVMSSAMLVVGKAKGIDVFAGGDISFAAAAGAWLGFAALPSFLLVVSGSYLLYATPLRIKGQMMVPMGPALGFALVACAVFPPSMGWFP
jgi:leader peptidase (prepilin peptidase)/N-methyltransferase